MPAIVGLVAKLMVLIENAFESFVIVQLNPQDYDNLGGAGYYCMPTVNATLTQCGAQLAHLWEKTIFAASNLGVYLLAALGVTYTEA